MNALATSLPIHTPERRSLLPSVLGWIAIVCGLLGVLSGLTYASLFVGVPVGDVVGTDPALQQAAVNTFSTAGLVYAVVSAAYAYVGFALWRRRNWARVTTIVLLVLGIVANVAWALISLMFSQLFADFGAMLGGLFTFSAIVCVAVAAFFVWCIVRLRSPAVVAEFA